MKVMKVKGKSVAVFLAVLLFGCGGGGRSTRDDSRPKSFPMVTIPVYLTEPSQRADYMAVHFWDRFDFSDTVLVSCPEVTEQGFSNYIGILARTSSYEKARSGLEGLLDKASVDSTTYAHFLGLCDKYLYEANSPLRNEEFYITVLQYVIGDPDIPEADKIRPQARLEMAMKNRLGSRAENFGFTMATGRRMSLYDVEADYVVLFFYNLGCRMCKEVREKLMAVLENPSLSELSHSGRLKVVAIYPDRQLDDWKKYLGDIPGGWLNGYDETQSIEANELYDLKAIPSLYLLDRDKRVLLKDFTEPELIAGSIRGSGTR